MKRLQYAKELCKQFHAFTGVPISLYHKGQKVFVAESGKLSDGVDFYKSCFPENTSLPVSFRVIDDCFLFACLPQKEEELLFLFGPAVMSKPDQFQIKKFESVCGIKQDSPRNSDYLSNMRVIKYSYIIQILCFLYLTIHGEAISVSELIAEADVPRLPVTDVNSQFDRQQELDFGNTPLHTFYSFEKEMLFFIRNGQPQNLIRLIEDNPVGNVGSIAETNLRQEKDYAIISISLATRAAIESGLSKETAFGISDTSIQKIELCRTVSECDRINYDALVEFAERVSSLRTNNCTDPLIKRVVEYVSEHIYSKILLCDIAERFHANRSYLSKKFKAEIGIPFNDYVNNLKITESKKLLVYTSKSLSEIAECLYFTTQSHFQNTFKRIEGITPAAYRKNHSDTPQKTASL